MPFGTAVAVAHRVSWDGGERYDFRPRFGWSGQAFFARQGGTSLICAGRLPLQAGPVIRRDLRSDASAQMGDLDGGVRVHRGHLRQLPRWWQGIDTIVRGRVRPRMPAARRGSCTAYSCCTRRIKGESLFGPRPRRTEPATRRARPATPPEQIDEISGAVRKLHPPVPLGVNPHRRRPASEPSATRSAAGSSRAGDHHRLRRARRPARCMAWLRDTARSTLRLLVDVTAVEYRDASDRSEVAYQLRLARTAVADLRVKGRTRPARRT